MVRALIISTISLPVIVLAIIGAIFLLKPMPGPQNQSPVQKLSEREKRIQIKKHAMQDFRNKRWADIRHTLDSLFTVIDFLHDSLRLKETKIDSLNQKFVLLQSQMDQAKKEIESLQKKIASTQQQQKRIKDLAKTLSGLKGKNLANIVAKMDDEALMQIYLRMSTTAKKNLLAGLPPHRAAALAQKMLKN